MQSVEKKDLHRHAMKSSQVVARLDEMSVVRVGVGKKSKNAMEFIIKLVHIYGYWH